MSGAAGVKTKVTISAIISAIVFAGVGVLVGWLIWGKNDASEGVKDSFSKEKAEKELSTIADVLGMDKEDEKKKFKTDHTDKVLEKFAEYEKAHTTYKGSKEAETKENFKKLVAEADALSKVIASFFKEISDKINAMDEKKKKEAEKKFLEAIKKCREVMEAYGHAAWTELLKEMPGSVQDPTAGETKKDEKKPEKAGKTNENSAGKTPEKSGKNTAPPADGSDVNAADAAKKAAAPETPPGDSTANTPASENANPPAIETKKDEKAAEKTGETAQPST
ncbi:MAG: uncharacterized protein A8A55_2483 [Amphiamblys sp. WSBS2006]|nr:MAG: uncharacterized protein A8A55_2483 [Amphiamblys sp. WSBS2006]